MSRLSSEAEELVRAGRAALRPSELDRQRVFERLALRLAGSAGTEPAASELSRPGTAGLPLAKIASLVLALGATGAGSFLLLCSEHAPTAAVVLPIAAPSSPASAPLQSSEPSAPEPTEVAPAPRAPLASTSVEVSAAPPAAPRARLVRRAATSVHLADTLADEVALLSRATAELQAERPAAALDVLAEHERRFPNGLLGEERVAARVRALCALGRTDEARAEIARLIRAAPGSPYAARAAQGCPSRVGSGLGVCE